MKHKFFFRTGFLIIACAIIGSGCSDQVGPGTKPYLNIYGEAVFLLDSTGGRWVTDSSILIQMSDGSNFHLAAGSDDGYWNCFSWAVDDSLDATYHHVIFHANVAAIKQLAPKTIWEEADYYPVVLNTTNFVSDQPLRALAANPDSIH